MPSDHASPADPPRVRRFAIVLNHSAGALVGSDDPMEVMRKAFALHDVIADFIPMEAGALPARVTLARDAGADAVVVIGGDGTVACAAQLLVGTDTPLGILPSGTMNILARDLKIPIGDLDAGIKVLADFHVRAIDVGEVNGRVFLCGSMVGLPTVLGQVRESGRGKSLLRSWARYAGAALRVFRTYRPLRLGLHTAGRHWKVRSPALMITPNPLADKVTHQMGRTLLDGGMLAAYIFARLKLIDAVRIGVPAMLGRWSGDEAVEELSLPELTITGHRPSMRVMNDGEAMLLDMPLRYVIRPRALNVLAPMPATKGELAA